MSCSLLSQRNPRSGFYDGSSGTNHWADVAGERSAYEREIAMRELGYSRNQNLEDAQLSSVNQRVYLNRLENKLRNKEIREQYFRHKPYFKSDGERLAFLSLNSDQERLHWLERNQGELTKTLITPKERAAIDHQDIFVGMSSGAVAESWGEPREVEVAGNPIYQNFRWTFEKQVPTTDGYQLETRVVYFEAGRVVGWKTQ